jgi:hypothetical protein
VIRKPYVGITEHERDRVLRMILNLNTLKVQHGADQVSLACMHVVPLTSDRHQESMVAAPHTFSVYTKSRGLLLQVGHHFRMNVAMAHVGAANQAEGAGSVARGHGPIACRLHSLQARHVAEEAQLVVAIVGEFSV